MFQQNELPTDEQLSKRSRLSTALANVTRQAKDETTFSENKIRDLEKLLLEKDIKLTKQKNKIFELKNELKRERPVFEKSEADETEDEADETEDLETLDPADMVTDLEPSDFNSEAEIDCDDKPAERSAEIKPAKPVVEHTNGFYIKKALEKGLKCKNFTDKSSREKGPVNIISSKAKSSQFFNHANSTLKTTYTSTVVTRPTYK